TLSADAEVSMEVKSRSDNFMLSIDGRSESALVGTKILIKKAPHTIKVLKRSEGSFFRTLRNKLMWGADTRE
ncbi:MAG: NAD(+) kinase, partial [Bacteroidaceae bacterium]|nr:NAD(+) kinase [Bacteroidaceae bacterium]